MTKYEELVSKAEMIGVNVIELDLEGESGYIYNDTIFISESMDDVTKRCVLAEELGHYFKNLGDITDQDKVENVKQELIARRYGYKLLIEPNDIVEAFRSGATTIFEIAEFLHITVDTLGSIIEDFKKIYGIGITVGTYYITLEPQLGVVQDLRNILNYKNVI